MGKPVLVLREATERPEVLTSGVARLVGTNPDEIVRVVRTLLEDDKTHERMAVPVSPYGDGHATARIMATLAYLAGAGPRPDDFSPSEHIEMVPEREPLAATGGTLRCSRDLMRFGLLEILVLLSLGYALSLLTISRRRRPGALPAPDDLFFVFLIPCPQRGTGDRSNNQEPPRRS